MTTMLGRDSVSPTRIPVLGTQYAYGYVNGRISQWPANGWSRFPAARPVRIDVDGSAPHADELDVERYDATPATAVNWMHAKVALKGPHMPSIYCDRSTRPTVRALLLKAGYTAGKDYGFRIATLDGTKTVDDMAEVIGVQFREVDGEYDESIIYMTSWMAPETPPPSRGSRTVIVGQWPAWDSTLWGIAAHYYGDGGKWETIYHVNAGQIGTNPSDIRPGMVLVIP